ncbi:unnamed protein product [Closterium sp. Naga37s-1]|nr:unnamed protein product [Closterium sp. Naga37s-1]
MLLVRSPSLLSLPLSCLSCHAIRTHPFGPSDLSELTLLFIYLPIPWPRPFPFFSFTSPFPAVVSNPLFPGAFLILFLLSRFSLSFSSFSCLVSHSPSPLSPVSFLTLFLLFLLSRFSLSFVRSQWGWCGSNDSFCGAGCQNGPCSGEENGSDESGSRGFRGVFKEMSPHDRSLSLPPSPLSPRQVEEMASKNHVNLVRLLGYCSHMDAATGGIEQILIYEYMHNGDLEGWVGPGRLWCGSTQKSPVMAGGMAGGIEQILIYEYMHNGDLEGWVGSDQVGA